MLKLKHGFIHPLGLLDSSSDGLCIVINGHYDKRFWQKLNGCYFIGNYEEKG